MKMNNILKSKKSKTLAFVGLGTMAILGTIALNANNPEVFKVSTNVLNHERTNIEYNHDEMLYLSDLDYIKSMSHAGWKDILNDITTAGSLINVKIEGGNYNFEKGVWAHAPATIVYDISAYDYNYFTAYIGLNATAASSSNGVKYFIYTSDDCQNWTLKTAENPNVLKPGQNAEYVEIDIRDVNYLKIVFDANGANGNDHSVLADAKLVKALDTTTYTKSLDEYDELIKKYTSLEINSELEHLILQREFVSRVGSYAVKRFAEEDEANAQMLNWLLNDPETLRLYILGGNPDGGNYYNSLKILKRLYENYKTDLDNKELLNNVWDPTLTYGDLYRKMMVTLSLTHTGTVALWMQPSKEENKSDPVRRYAIYRYLHKNGKFIVTKNEDGTPKVDMTPWFESLKVEEMRMVLNNIIDDEEILWLNAYVQSRIDAAPASYGGLLTPHPYMAYVYPNYSNPVYYAEENYDYFNELFAVPDPTDPSKKVGLWDVEYTIPGGTENAEYKIKITRGTESNKIYKVWMNIRNKFGTGAVCGGISKTGSNIRTTHGIPAVVIGQPGHAAILYYTKNSAGQGYWNIDNNVSGWTLSEKGERMLLGWGNAAYQRGYSIVYMVLAQEAINDYDNLVKSEELVMLAKAYQNDLNKQEEIYRKALDAQSINIDVWYNLIQNYNANPAKTEKDYYNLAEEMANDLMAFPLPMTHLMNLIKAKITTPEYKALIMLLEKRTLQTGSNLPNTATDIVLQPAVTRVEALYLLGQRDNTIATFSFDGQNAGKIVLSAQFNNTGIRFDYSIDGKKTWKEVSLTAEEEHSVALTSEEIKAITAENDILVHIVGTSYDDDNIFTIDILNQTAPTVYNNDWENKVMGTLDVTEWKMDDSSWQLFTEKLPDLTGDKTITVRNKSNGVYLTSEEITLTFTKDTDTPERKYVTIDRLTLNSFSSEAAAQNRYAKYIIDGNKNTSWHSAWNGSDKDKFLVIEFDKAINLSAVEYQPVDGGNGKILSAKILGSIDGENFFEIVSSTSWAFDMNLKNVEIPASPRVKYVKIIGEKTSSASSLSFIAGSMLNFYEDTTKIEKPTAEIEYSTLNPTRENVTVKLINPSTPITITNNEGSDTYTFTENGSFTFEFEDEYGVKGSATATVNNIDRIAPTADVTYSETNLTNKDVIVTLTNISEDAIITNNDGNNTYTFTENGSFTFILTDEAGNKADVVAEVKNIDKIIPTATIKYTTLESGDVVATLTNASKTIMVLNNGGKISYTFTKNGIFIFMFKDGAGNIGTSIATVNTINKKDNNQNNPSNNENNNSNTQIDRPIINIKPEENEPNNNNNNNNIVNDNNILKNGIFTLESEKLDSLKFRAIKNALTKSLTNMLGKDTDYYTLYLEDADSNIINLTSKSILKINIANDKNLAGIYLMGSDNILEPVTYSLENNVATIEVEELKGLVIDYEDEKKEDIKKPQEEKKEESNRANYNMITIGAMLIAAGVTGLVLAKRKNKQNEK